MSELLKLIQEADVVALEMETARAAVETAKQSLEMAKESYEQTKKSFEEVLLKADELGVPRPKVRKLIEERTSALVASGLISGEGRSANVKLAKAPKASRKKAANSDSDENIVEFEVDGDASDLSTAALM